MLRPLWDRVLADTRDDFKSSKVRKGVSSLRCGIIEAEKWYENSTPKEPDAEEDYDAWEKWWDSKVATQPEAVPFVPPASPRVYDILSSRSSFQVIVKLANIELRPGKETYDGGSWHIEEQLNERIRASAIYYYDEDNISTSKLAFRQACDELDDYVINDDTGIEQVFGIERDEPLIQQLGSVVTRQNRLLAFSNMMQHQVQPFELIDKSRPGWRKILAFFLVDPTIRVMSTAIVPPQQRDWWARLVRISKPFRDLPQELFDASIAVSVSEFFSKKMFCFPFGMTSIGLSCFADTSFWGVFLSGP